MSAHRFWLLLVVTVTLSSVALAQGPGVEVQAGLGYARVFHGGGISFAAAAERPITSDSSALRHALGLSFWYANTTVASTPDAPGGRELVGLGFRYELSLRSRSRYVRPVLAVPIQVLRSSIPERTFPAAAGVSFRAGPELPGSFPVEDREGAAWGWGAGLEFGIHVALGDQLSAQTSVQGMYQDIYAASTMSGAWTWHAGVTYRFGARS
jgi:hypothetical protein